MATRSKELKLSKCCVVFLNVPKSATNCVLRFFCNVESSRYCFLKSCFKLVPRKSQGFDLPFSKLETGRLRKWVPFDCLVRSAAFSGCFCARKPMLSKPFIDLLSSRERMPQLLLWVRTQAQTRETGLVRSFFHWSMSHKAKFCFN